jgi:release factor glutamine methyltransferase
LERNVLQRNGEKLPAELGANALLAGSGRTPEPLQHGKSEPLVALGKLLQEQAYRFTAVTPATHARVLARKPEPQAENLTDIFGWSQVFRPEHFPAVTELLQEAGELDTAANGLRSRVRFSTLGKQLYLHSAYPTDAPDAVFFGPDTYRFARIIKHFLPKGKNRPTRIIDLGCGSGAGGIYAASLISEDRPEIRLVDINAKALQYSYVNCVLNDAQPTVTLVQSDLFESVEGMADLIISNPPYLVDAAARAYRHGGARGFDLSLRIANESLDRLSPRGRLILYTGTPVVGGADQFLASLSKSFAARAQPFLYEEVDPDVFGEELDNPNYSHADRIAVVAVVTDLQ